MVGDPRIARRALRDALACDIVVFTSPAAVRFAAKLAALRSRARVLAPGTGTLRSLRRAGVIAAQAPAREDSEGLLGLPAMDKVRGLRVGIIGAAGGRGLLETGLAVRGATVVHAHVYRREPARLDRRHVDGLRRASRKPLYVLLSSAEAIANIVAGLPREGCATLRAGTAVASSARLAAAARKARFTRVLRAASPHAAAMLAAIIADRAGSLTRRTP